MMRQAIHRQGASWQPQICLERTPKDDGSRAGGRSCMLRPNGNAHRGQTSGTEGCLTSSRGCRTGLRGLRRSDEQQLGTRQHAEAGRLLAFFQWELEAKPSHTSRASREHISCNLYNQAGTRNRTRGNTSGTSVNTGAVRRSGIHTNQEKHAQACEHTAALLSAAMRCAKCQLIAESGRFIRAWGFQIPSI
jgi:hypothetical protein